MILRSKPQLPGRATRFSGQIYRLLLTRHTSAVRLHTLIRKLHARTPGAAATSALSSEEAHLSQNTQMMEVGILGSTWAMVIPWRGSNNKYMSRMYRWTSIISS